jgi:hypothetical protein
MRTILIVANVACIVALLYYGGSWCVLAANLGAIAALSTLER